MLNYPRTLPRALLNYPRHPSSRCSSKPVSYKECPVDHRRAAKPDRARAQPRWRRIAPGRPNRAGIRGRGARPGPAPQAGPPGPGRPGRADTHRPLPPHLFRRSAWLHHRATATPLDQTPMAYFAGRARRPGSRRRRRPRRGGRAGPAGSAGPIRAFPLRRSRCAAFFRGRFWHRGKFWGLGSLQISVKREISTIFARPGASGFAPRLIAHTDTTTPQNKKVKISQRGPIRGLL